jgi:hypothetical protein
MGTVIGVTEAVSGRRRAGNPPRQAAKRRALFNSEMQEAANGGGLQNQSVRLQFCRTAGFADDFGAYGRHMLNYFCSPRNHVRHLTQPS